MRKARLLAATGLTVIGLASCAAKSVDTCGTTNDPSTACEYITIHYDALEFHSGDCLVGPRWEISFIKSHGPYDEGCK